MPAYHSEGTIAESIASVQAQTIPDWELVIVDDASTDRTREVAESLAVGDYRIRVVPQDANYGVARARNAGLKVARGRYIAFLDSDDLWLPEKLECQLRFMKDSGCAFSYTAYRRFWHDNGISDLVKVPPRINYSDLLKGNAIPCLTVMIDRQQIPNFEMPSIPHEDYACWLQILRCGTEAQGLLKDLARYRVSNSSLSGRKQRSAAWTWRIYRDLEKLSFPHAVWCFAHYSARGVYKHYLS